jgi:hypothetical protein
MNADLIAGAAYLFTIIALVLYAVRFGDGPGSARIQASIMFALGALLLVLLALKILEVQFALTEAGRSLARDEGWYAQRRIVQAVGVLFIPPLCFIPCFKARHFIWRAPLKSTLLVALLLVSYLSIRAVSLHQIDSVLYGVRAGDFSLGAFLEIVLVVVLGLTVIISMTVKNRPTFD